MPTTLLHNPQCHIVCISNLPKYIYINAKIFFTCNLFSVGSQEEPDLEIQAFKICDTNKDDALTWQEVEDCEVCIY